MRALFAAASPSGAVQPMSLYGHRNAILFDPVGHKVEFFEPLAST